MGIKQRSVNVAEAKKRFSELLGRVAFGKETILVTKRGVPMAEIIPFEEKRKQSADIKGWLDDDDPFFLHIGNIIADRKKHIPRVMRKKG